MKQKSLWDIYVRNAKGIFLGGFKTPGVASTGEGIRALLHICALPLSLTFIAGIKSLFDFFTRKELPVKEIDALHTKISTLDEKTIVPLIHDITHYNADSNSSKLLIANLKTVSSEVKKVAMRGKAEILLALQIDQLRTQAVPDPKKHYLPEVIMSTKLDTTHQKLLDTYVKANEFALKKFALNTKKAQIAGYISADHNAGKKMEHVIYNHFFSQDVIGQSVNTKDKPRDTISAQI